eukprot:jgi/Undpi1/12689/HiC_scaffold_6.g02357.m1
MGVASFGQSGVVVVAAAATVMAAAGVSGSPVTHPYAPTRSDFEEPGPLETAASHGSRLVCRPPQPAVRKRGGAERHKANPPLAAPPQGCEQEQVPDKSVDFPNAPSDALGNRSTGGGKGDSGGQDKRPKSRSSSTLPPLQSAAMGDRESPSSCLFVSDLPSDITEKELERLFNGCHGFDSCRVRKDKNEHTGAENYSGTASFAHLFFELRMKLLEDNAQKRGTRQFKRIFAF